MPELDRPTVLGGSAPARRTRQSRANLPPAIRHSGSRRRGAPMLRRLRVLRRLRMLLRRVLPAVPLGRADRWGRRRSGRRQGREGFPLRPAAGWRCSGAAEPKAGSAGRSPAGGGSRSRSSRTPSTTRLPRSLTSPKCPSSPMRRIPASSSRFPGCSSWWFPTVSRCPTGCRDRGVRVRARVRARGARNSPGFRCRSAGRPRSRRRSRQHRRCRQHRRSHRRHGVRRSRPSRNCPTRCSPVPIRRNRSGRRGDAGSESE